MKHEKPPVEPVPEAAYSEVDEERNIGVVHLTTNSDADHVGSLAGKLLQSEGVSTLAFDLSKTELLDSAGLGAIIWAYRTGQELGKPVHLKHIPSQRIARIFELTHFNRVFSVIDDEGNIIEDFWEKQAKTLPRRQQVIELWNSGLNRT